MTFDLEQCVAVLQRTPAVLEALLGGLSDEWTMHNEGGGSWKDHQGSGPDAELRLAIRPDSGCTNGVDIVALERALRARLAQDLPGPEAQLRFAPRPLLKGWRPELTPEGARQAAALILIYPGANGPSIPLTARRDDLPHHPGQISLPGGRVDPGERPDVAALREAEEEIGVDRRRVRLIGRLSSLWVVVSNHVVQPFVGITDKRPDFRPSPREVAALLEVPVSAIGDSARVGWSQRARQGIVVTYPHYEFDGHHVWGATAMILGEFGEVLRSKTEHLELGT